MKIQYRGVLLAAVLTAGAAWAQNYVVSSVSQTYSPMTGGTPVTFTARTSSTASDEGFADLPLQFSFPFYGKSYTQVHVDSNGYLTFDFNDCDLNPPYYYYCQYSYGIPSTSYPPWALIAGWWYDMDGQAAGIAAGTVSYKSSATQFEVEYLNYPDSYGDFTITMKYTLHADGTIEIAYGSLGGPYSYYAYGYQGIQNATGSQGKSILNCGGYYYCDDTYWPANQLFTVGPPVQPDLMVTDVKVSNMAVVSGGNLTFNVLPTFVNFGQSTASNVQWRAYLSTNAVLDAADQLVYTSSTGLNFAGVGSSGNIVTTSGAAATTTAPASGTNFYILVQIDSSGCSNGSTTSCGSITEADETNDVGATSNYFTQGIDLVATSVSGPSTTGPGATIQLESKFFNQGVSPAGTTQYQVFLSTDNMLSAGDFKIYDSTKTVTGGETVDDVASVVLPDNTPGGDFYLLLVLDPSNTVTEASETNNLAVSSSTMSVRPAELANLATDFLDPVTGASSRVGYFGGTARVQVSATNTGGADSKTYKIGVVVSTDATLSLLSDTLVYELSVPSLAAGDSHLYDFTFPMPLSDKNGHAFATGPFYVFTVLDSTSAVNEVNKTNNILPIGGAVTLRAPSADLATLSVQAPAAGGVGETIPVVRTLKNIGNVDAPAANYRYYASANDIITPDDTPLQIVSGTTPADYGTVTLAAGAADTASELVQLPSTLSPGTYYIGVIADTDGAVTEWDEVNNALASNPIVLASGSLHVTTSQLPDAIAGRPFSFGLAAAGAMGALGWSIDTSQGNLPNGLSLAANGLISGTPASPVVTAFTAIADDGVHQAAARLVLRVLPTTTEVEITTTAIPPVINSPSLTYSYQLGAAGGVRPYAWSLVQGALPANLTLSADGVISGSPRAGLQEGTSQVVVQVTDSLGTKATQSIPVRILAPGSIQFTNLSLPDALVGQDYAADLSVQNADGSALAVPITFDHAGALPDGMSFEQQGEVALISGKPTHAGLFTFSLTVTDKKGRSDTTDFMIRVYPSGLTVTGKDVPELMHPGDAAGFSFVASTGLTPHFSLFSGTLPPGLTLNDDGTVTGNVATDGSVGTWDFVVTVTDGTGATGLGAYTVQVAAVPKKTGCGCNESSGGAIWLLGLLAPFALRKRRTGTEKKREGVPGSPVTGLAAVLAVTLALLVPVAAHAQTYQLVGPTNITYQPIPSGQNLNPGFDGVNFSIPFTFKFYGVPASSFTVSQYGYVAFSGDGYESYNPGIPSSDSYYPTVFIAPWWDDLDYATGIVRAQTFGTAPNRYTVVEWSNMKPYGGTGAFSFELVLYEGTNQIRFAYGPTPPTLASASVGLQQTLGTGMAALSCTSASSGSCGTGGFPANQAIDFFLPPDLVVNQVSGDQVGYASVSYRTTAVITNVGGRGVLGAPGVMVRFYLSTDATLDSGDLPLGDSNRVDLDPFEQKLVAGVTRIPASVTPGDYFVIAMVDPDNAIAEQNETNNVGTPNPVTIGPPTADLVVTQVAAPTTAQPGQQIQVQRTLTNVGNAAAGSFKYTYFLSNNSVVTISDMTLDPVGTVASLDPGTSDSQMEMITLPDDLPAGQYWLGVCVNYDPTATPQFGITEISLVNDCFTGNAITLSTGALMVQTVQLAAATQYSPYGLHLEASGGDGSYAWSLTGGSLPPGMSLSTTGDLVGNPNGAGSFSFQVSVSSGGSSQSANLSLTVADGSLPLAIVDQQLPAAEFSRAYAASLVAVGGKPPYQWALAADSQLPPGLGLSTDGLVEGRASQAGDFPFTVQLTDSAGTVVVKDLEVKVVNPANLHIALHGLPLGYLKSSYLVPLDAVGGKAPYTWDLESFQQLPENLTEAPGPVLTAFPDGFGIAIEDGGNAVQYLRGTPGLAGLYAVTLKVTDATGATDFAQLLLRVSYAAGLQITTTALPDAFVGHEYKTVLSTNADSDTTGLQFDVPCVMQPGDQGAFNCISIVDPKQNVPPGIVLAADGTVEGTAVADSSAKGPVTYTFLVRVRDAAGREDVRGLAIKVQPDYAKAKSGGCSGTGLDPSMLGLLWAAALLLKRRRR